MHFNVQMKATQNYSQNSTTTKYELDAEAHDRLVAHDEGPIVLIVFCVPKLANERFLMNEDNLTIYRCCYWYPRPVTITPNKRSVTIDLPRKNLFDPKACRLLMDLARERKL